MSAPKSERRCTVRGCKRLRLGTTQFCRNDQPDVVEAKRRASEERRAWDERRQAERLAEEERLRAREPRIPVQFVWSGETEPPWDRAAESDGILDGCWLSALPAADDFVFVPHYTGEIQRVLVEECTLLPYGGARVWVSEAALDGREDRR